MTNGQEWQLRVMAGGGRMFHVHALEKLGGRLYAAPSAWSAGLHVSGDGGYRWKQIYDHSAPKGNITRIISLAAFNGKLFGAVVQRRAGAPRHPLRMLDGDKVTKIPGWPETARTHDLIAAKGGVYGLTRDGDKVEFWLGDGTVAERISDHSMPGLRAVAADATGFWGAGDGDLWRSATGKNWRRVRGLTGGRPIDMVIHRGQIYIGGVGSDGRGILWGPGNASVMTSKPGGVGGQAGKNNLSITHELPFARQSVCWRNITHLIWRE